MRRRLLLLGALGAGVARARPREQRLEIAVELADRNGRPIAGKLPVTLWRPEGAGPFPLLLLNHGRNSRQRAERKPPRYPAVSAYFVAKGFAVALPQRLGYGASAALGDPEAMGSCRNPRFAAQLAAQATQLRQLVTALAAEPGIDTGRLVLAGISAGGMAALAGAAELAPLAALNFAGSLGAEPQLRPGQPCASERLADELRRLGAASAAVPTLWVYADNDLRFTPALVRRWAQAWRDGGGQAELLQLPPHGDDGHHLFSQQPERWQPAADAFLARLPLSVKEPLP